MDMLPLLVFMAIFIGLTGMAIHFLLEYRAKRKKAEKYPFQRFADDEPVGEKKHCDAYSAGTFYW